MAVARDIVRAGDWRGPVADSVLLDYDGRQRRRIALVGIGGTTFLLDLERVMGLQEGDALRLEDDRLILVNAMPEPLLAVRGQDSGHLLRLAWHLGNRHLPTQIEAARLLVRADHVIADMLRTLQAEVVEITEPFRPERGAYGLGTTLGHDHSHAEGGPS